jgi:hypothetical protein
MEKMAASSATGASLIAGAKLEEILEPTDETTAVLIKSATVNEPLILKTLAG